MDQNARTGDAKYATSWMELLGAQSACVECGRIPTAPWLQTQVGASRDWYLQRGLGKGGVGILIMNSTFRSPGSGGGERIGGVIASS